MGVASLEYLEQGASVYGIDIAENYIQEARRAASEDGYPKDRFRFEVMDAHRMAYAPETFDVVIGNGILHHLEPDVAMAEIYRVLKPGGRVLLQEPLADNPLLRVFRRLTPKARTQDERPFTKSDLTRLMDKRKWGVEAVYCGVVEAPLAMLTSILLPKHPQNWLMFLADVFERWLHRHKLLMSWNKYVLFNLVKKVD